MKDVDAWAKERLAQLKAAAQPQRKRAEPFVKLPLSWAAKAAAATKCPKAIVWVWLIHRAWQTKSSTVSVPNGALAKLGVSRNVKRKALQQLEAAGLVAINRQSRKTPSVTLLQTVSV
jgi:hypothetical protein